MAELPVEYIPLSRDNLEAGMKFGTCRFTVKPASNEKTATFLGTGALSIAPLLFPSELWGMARVLSKTFGRLNEVVLAFADWELFHIPAYAGIPVKARSEVLGKKTDESKGLSLVKICTETSNINGQLLLRAVDTVLLLHDMPGWKYKDRTVEQTYAAGLVASQQRKVRMRYNWDKMWVNNIHQDAYARQFGYDSGLPEFIVYMDWIYLAICHADAEDWYGGKRRSMRICLKRVFPLYVEDVVTVSVHQEHPDLYTVRFIRDSVERLLATIYMF